MKSPVEHRFFQAGFAFTILLAVAASSLANESLSQAVQTMLDYEPEIRAVGFDTEVSEHEQKIVNADRLPQLNLSGSAGLYNRDRSIDGLEQSTGGSLFSRQLGVNMRQLLFDFGESGNRNQSAKNRTIMQSHIENAMIEGRAVDLAEVYLEVLRLREQLRLSTENIEEHRRVANAMQAKFENGGDRADVALVEGRLQLAKTEREAKLLALGHAEGRYLRLTGQKPGDLIKPIAPRPPVTREQIDLSNNWYILAADEAVKMAQATRKAEAKAGGPKLFAEGGYSVGEDVLGIEGQDNEARALLVLSWNLFDGGRNKHRKLRGMTLEHKAVELAHGAVAEQNYQVTLIWGDLVSSKNTRVALKSYADRLNQVSADYDEQFELGKRDILSILDVQNELHAAESRLLDAGYEELASKFRLVGLQGKLVSSLTSSNALVSAKKSSSFFGKRKAKVATSSPVTTLNGPVVPSINTELATAEIQKAPIEISFGSESDIIRKAKAESRVLYIGGRNRTAETKEISTLRKPGPAPKVRKFVELPQVQQREFTPIAFIPAGNSASYSFQ